MTKFSYRIWSINEEEHWIFIQSDDEYKMDLEEPDAFICLVKTIQSHLNGTIVSLGMTQYKIDNDQYELIFQWDDLFGMVVIYPDSMQVNRAKEILRDYLTDAWRE